MTATPPRTIPAMAPGPRLVTDELAESLLPPLPPLDPGPDTGTTTPGLRDSVWLGESVEDKEAGLGLCVLVPERDAGEEDAVCDVDEGELRWEGVGGLLGLADGLAV